MTAEEQVSQRLSDLPNLYIAIFVAPLLLCAACAAPESSSPGFSSSESPSSESAEEFAAQMPSAAGSEAPASEAYTAQQKDRREDRAITPHKSPSDPRSYRFVQLGNGLRVLLVSDPNSDRAAASLAVAAGSRDDPPDRPGLAHFLEHMLFLGTDLFPEPNEYQNFIFAHGGSYNAYTSLEQTNYFFHVQPGAFSGALQRFSQFFIAPRMDMEYVEREREAVDAEYRAGLDNTFRREQDVLRTRLNPAHPYARFTVGNLDTLKVEGMREALLNFYNAHYAAERMTLVLLAKLDLAVLEQLARRYFSAIATRDLPEPTVIESPLFLPGSLPQKVRIEPQRERNHLSMVFALPDPAPHYRSKPLHHIANLVGHEGRGSLFSLLKSRGWAESLVAGGGLRYRGGASFRVDIELTEQGLANSDAVAAAVFAALRRFREQGVARWVFDEQKRLAELAFRFMEIAPPLSAVRALSRLMHLYPPQEILQASILMEEFRPQLIQRYLDLLRPENCLMLLTARGGEFDAVSPRYDTPYRVEAFAVPERPDLYSQIAIPQPNPFIPRDIKVLPPSTVVSSSPTLLIDEPGLRLWYRRPLRFRLPRADSFFQVEFPLRDMRESAMAELLTAMVTDQLNEYSYPALLAGLSYSIQSGIHGIEIRISGYHDRHSEILQRIALALTRPTLSENRFADIKSRGVRFWRNKFRDPPYQNLLAQLPILLTDTQWPADLYAQTLEEIDIEDLRSFVSRLVREGQINALVHGNLSEEKATEMAYSMRTLFPGIAPTRTLRVTKLKAGESWYQNIALPDQDRAVILYRQAPSNSWMDRAASALGTQIFRGDFFHELRTVRQLGYIVFHSDFLIYDVPGNMFVIQAPDLEVADLAQEIRWFATFTERRLQTLSAPEFERHRKAVLSRILETPKTRAELSQRYWDEIARKQYAFDTRERLAAQVRDLDYEQWLRFYSENFLGPAAREVILLAPGGGEAAQIFDAREIENIDAFRRTHPNYETP